MTEAEYEERFQELFDREKAVWASEDTVSASEILGQIQAK